MTNSSSGGQVKTQVKWMMTLSAVTLFMGCQPQIQTRFSGPGTFNDKSGSISLHDEANPTGVTDTTTETTSNRIPVPTPAPSPMVSPSPVPAPAPQVRPAPVPTPAPSPVVSTFKFTSSTVSGLYSAKISNLGNESIMRSGSVTTSPYPIYSSGLTHTDIYLNRMEEDCISFFENASAITSSSLSFDSIQVEGFKAQLKDARVVSYATNSGGILNVLSVANLGTLRNDRGIAHINATQMNSITNSSGEACLRASDINQVISTSAVTTVLANHVRYLENTGGTLHIYNAVVDTLKNTDGVVCLHNGAQVTSYSGAAPVQNCP